MSYCRWSSDEYDCDLYVYESLDGFEVHVARRRYDVDRSVLPPAVDILVDMEAWSRRHNALMALLDTATSVDIGLPCDGESFTLDTAGECADKIADLAGMGYHVPDGVVESLRAEVSA